MVGPLVLRPALAAVVRVDCELQQRDRMPLVLIGRNHVVVAADRFAQQVGQLPFARDHQTCNAVAGTECIVFGEIVRALGRVELRVAVALDVLHQHRHAAIVEKTDEIRLFGGESSGPVELIAQDAA